MRVEAKANNSRSKICRILYEYACTISYEFADLVNCMNYYYFNMTLLRFLPGGAVGYVKKKVKETSNAVQIVKVLRPTQTYHWKCIPLQLLVFSVNAQYGQIQIP